MAENQNERIVFDEQFNKEQDLREKESFGSIDEGEYEVTIDKIDKRVSKDGTKKYLSVSYRIRKDVNQKFQNRIVWETIFQDSRNTAWYDLSKIRKLVGTQVGGKKDFASCDECLLYLQGKPLIISISKEFDDVKGEDKNVVGRNSYKPTNSKASLEETKKIAVSDEDLPF